MAHVAAQYAKIGDVENVKKHFHELITFSDYKTVLDKAIAAGYLNIVKLFIENDFDIHSNREHVLYIALQHKQTEIVNFLLDDKVDVTVSNNYLLFWAVQTENIEIIKIFVKKGADVNIHSGLSAAVSINSREILNIFIEAGADVTTALNVAITYDNTDIVNFLIEKGADMFSIDNVDNEHDLEFIRHLLRNGVNPHKILSTIDANNLYWFIHPFHANIIPPPYFSRYVKSRIRLRQLFNHWRWSAAKSANTPPSASVPQQWSRETAIAWLKTGGSTFAREWWANDRFMFPETSGDLGSFPHDPHAMAYGPAARQRDRDYVAQ